MKFLMVALAFCATLALVAGQNYLFGPRHFDYNSIDVPQATGASGRDPRQNRGPVVFPPSPPDAIDESSGVIVGASGYGFVPPQQSPLYYTTSALRSPSATSYASFNYYNIPYYQRLNFV
ncbi:uncharacterized protein LOC101894226 isoform X1 [Musca domestica]|uniref:Uncharacterized protein LOC101894226 isoform X1 n=1 Tax=Musca domestica TaxID=7370 RepID=A0ABM3VDT6_MUSDO|nr:uncharacterized protein LOC101894226 isoform X1 [Musca domestica]